MKHRIPVLGLRNAKTHKYDGAGWYPKDAFATVQTLKW